MTVHPAKTQSTFSIELLRAHQDVATDDKGATIACDHASGNLVEQDAWHDTVRW